ncbi:Hypothetical predicted protein [Mytilus galloprovincialis]|uniref:Uncharacterized protein n=1 Tax=Mytilus galloprovincialis TaxID=29158 RepID=A0A8B6EAF5_MYTGA|nr:Hypothetical predicted protein [Mytilus galloprovincialis]
MNEIQKQKLMFDVRKELDDETITDISDGLIYREILNDFKDEDAFLLTALLNTDGVNLYSSSKVELWPIFLAINELSPKARFSRDNLLLVGKAKPPFKSYFKSLSDQLNILYNDGINISKDGDNITVKLRVGVGV